jgi:hypothetical protein
VKNRDVSDELTYPKAAIVDLLRDLNVMVVSTDRIGSAWNDRQNDEEYNAMFVKFFDEFGFFRKLADARTLLSEPFSNEVGEDGMDELERQMQDLHYWDGSAAQQ